MVWVGFLSALLTNGARVGDEQVLDLVRLAEPVQRAGLRVVAHADGPDFVDDRRRRAKSAAAIGVLRGRVARPLTAGRRSSAVRPARWSGRSAGRPGRSAAPAARAARRGPLVGARAAAAAAAACGALTRPPIPSRICAEGVLHVADLVQLVIAPLPVEAQHRDAPLVLHLGIDLAVRLLVRDHLAAARQADAASRTRRGSPASSPGRSLRSRFTTPVNEPTPGMP